jgi:CDP-glucose 4,6-dehydratase
MNSGLGGQLRKLDGPVLVTGHTGFKGTWLTLLLEQLGVPVVGLSLPPENGSLYRRLNRDGLIEEIYADIRNFESVDRFIKETQPAVVINMAAQPLVMESYNTPRETFEANVMGTVNVLDSSFASKSVKAIIAVTTDKVYKNNNSGQLFRENDPLAGKDPYSASKVGSESAIAAWQQITRVQGGPSVVSVRAGNVIGGGDVCTDRLLPDLMHSYTNGLTPKLRAPNSVRPWQHVLDCLNGYLMLVDAMIQNKVGGSWNFGPDKNQFKTVADVADIAGKVWGVERYWERDSGNQPYEAPMLVLNSDKAKSELGWSYKLSFEESVEWGVNWYRRTYSGSDPLQETLKNIREFESRKVN